MGILDIDDFRQVLKTKRGDQRPKLSQPAISLELEKVKVKPSSQGTISNLEIRGRSALMNSWPDPRDRVTLLRIYGFTTEELIELDKKFDLGIQPFLEAETMTVHYSGAPKIDHVGTVSAGNGSGGVLVKQRSISAPDKIAQKFDLDYVFAAEVSGDSMTCEDVAKAIPEGATVFFHRPNQKMQPQPGDIVYVFLQSEDQPVLKVFEPNRNHTILTSYNQAQRPIVVDESNPGIVQGIYIGLELIGPRAR